MVYLLISKGYCDIDKLSIESSQNTKLFDSNIWVEKDVTPQTFVSIDCLLNCIVLKLFQPFQDFVHSLHSLFCLLFFCATN